MALDMSDRVSEYHVRRGDGHVLETGKIAMVRGPLGKLFSRWKGCRLVIEAGGHSPWVSRLGAECGMEVVVANPRRVELISKNDRKSDRVDAEILARLGMSDVKLLWPITHRSEEAQSDLAIRDARNIAVAMRTALINFVRGKLKSSGYRAETCAPECFHTRVVRDIPPQLAKALERILTLIADANREIKGYDKEIVQLCEERYPVTQVLQQVPGVGPLVSLSFVLTIDDPKRFEDGRDVGAYLGLVPRKKDSGASSPQLGISKAGDREMRRLLVLSANYILGRFGPDSDLRRFGLRIAAQGGKRGKKRARVAVARKLAVLMHHLMITGEQYDPLYLAKQRGELTAA
jgi:transposase